MAYTKQVYPFYFTCSDLSDSTINVYNLIEKKLNMRADQLSIRLYVDYSRFYSDTPKKISVKGVEHEVTKSLSDIYGIAHLAGATVNEERQIMTVTWNDATKIPDDWFFRSMGIVGDHSAGSQSILNVHDHVLLYPTKVYTLVLKGDINEVSTASARTSDFGKLELGTFKGYGIHTIVNTTSQTGSNYTTVESPGDAQIRYAVYDHSLNSELPYACLRGTAVHCRFQFYRP